MALAKRYTIKRVDHTKTLGILLYLFVIPPLISLVMALFIVDIRAFLLNFVSFLLFLAALFLSKKGFAQEFEYRRASFAKAPKIPYKFLGGVTLSLAVLYTSFVIAGYSLLQSLFLGLVAFVGYYLWYGFDPKKDKLPDTGDVGMDIALQTITKAKENIQKTKVKLDKIVQPLLRAQMEQTLKKADEVIEALAKKPSYVRDLRKFLVVYTQSLKDLADSYIKVQEHLDKEKVDSLLFLLDETQKRFEKELEKVQQSQKFDLEVKMRTLDHQIKSR